MALAASDVDEFGPHWRCSCCHRANGLALSTCWACGGEPTTSCEIDHAEERASKSPPPSNHHATMAALAARADRLGAALAERDRRLLEQDKEIAALRAQYEASLEVIAAGDLSRAAAAAHARASASGRSAAALAAAETVLAGAVEREKASHAGALAVVDALGKQRRAKASRRASALVSRAGRALVLMGIALGLGSLEVPQLTGKLHERLGPRPYSAVRDRVWDYYDAAAAAIHGGLGQAGPEMARFANDDDD